MSDNGSNGTNGSRLHLLHQPPGDRNATDDHGRVLRHTATVHEVHQIAAEEAQKVHEFYLRQIPPFVAQMVVDCLVGHGLIAVPAPDAPPASPHESSEGTEARVPPTAASD